MTQTNKTESNAAMQAFTFGDPVPINGHHNFLDYFDCTNYGKWYAPPIDFDALARSKRANVHHESALNFKRNMLVGTYIPNKLLSRTAFTALVDDYLLFGNAYLHIQYNRLHEAMGLRHVLAKYMRRGTNSNEYWFTPNIQQEQRYAAAKILHILQPDVNQQIYGLPEYLSALHSAWLNESATLFRRRYYENGSHAGFILYINDPAQKEEDIDNIRKALKDSRGPGNFKNLFMYSPNGKKDGIQLIPVSEVAARDEFFNVKNVTRDDVLAAHRVPPQLMGIVPQSNAGFGEVSKAAEVFFRNEIQPLQEQLKEINTHLGIDVIDFKPYTQPTTSVDVYQT